MKALSRLDRGRERERWQARKGGAGVDGIEGEEGTDEGTGEGKEEALEMNELDEAEGVAVDVGVLLWRGKASRADNTTGLFSL